MALRSASHPPYMLHRTNQQVVSSTHRRQDASYFAVLSAGGLPPESKDPFVELVIPTDERSEERRDLLSSPSQQSRAFANPPVF
jgi:hypothetical protein